MFLGAALILPKNSFSVIVREPLGVVGVISPWNWPIGLMMRDMIPALAAGNAVVVKPASLTAAISMAVMEVLAQVQEFPRGIVNAVTGPGQRIGEILATNDKVQMIAFTGDNNTGQRIGELAARGVKKLSLELGGKSPNVIFEDADLTKAIPGAIRAAFTNCGQICMAGTRLIVQDTIFDQVVERMKKAAESLKIGNGLDEKCQLGPLVSQRQLDTVVQYVELGKKEGKTITGGYRLTSGELEKGFFFAPTIFTGLDQKSRVVQEEIFGPVLTVHKFHSEAEAIELANDTKFGLAGAVWTNNLDRAIRVSREIKAGTVWVNTYMKTFQQAEFGGYKASGLGRARGIDGFNEFTEIKHINFDLKPTCD